MNFTTVTFSVPDMHCESCPKLITMDLQDTPGVISVNASLESKNVTVEFNESLTSTDKLISVIKNSGYHAQL